MIFELQSLYTPNQPISHSLIHYQHHQDILMNELLQLPDVTIISNDNRINLYFPLIVSPGCWLPAAVLGDESWRWKGQAERAPLISTPWLSGGEESWAHPGICWLHTRFMVGQEGALVHPETTRPRRSPELLSEGSKRGFCCNSW